MSETQAPDTTTESATASLEIAAGPDPMPEGEREVLFVDAAGHQYRLEGLPYAQRRAVLDAVARSLEPEVLPSNEALAAASRALSRHVRDLPPDGRAALMVDAALAIDTFESPVYEFRLEQSRQEVRRLTEANKDLFSLAERAVDALKTSTEFNCRAAAWPVR